MGGDVRVQEGRSGVMIMCVAHATHRLVHVGVRRRDEPEQEGHDRKGGPEPAQHDTSIVDVALPEVKRWAAVHLAL